MFPDWVQDISAPRGTEEKRFWIFSHLTLQSIPVSGHHADFYGPKSHRLQLLLGAEWLDSTHPVDAAHPAPTYGADFHMDGKDGAGRVLVHHSVPPVCLHNLLTLHHTVHRVQGKPLHAQHLLQVLLQLQAGTAQLRSEWGARLQRGVQRAVHQLSDHTKRGNHLYSQKEWRLWIYWWIQPSPRTQATQLLCTELHSTSPIIKQHILRRTEMFFTYYGKVSNISSVIGSFLKPKHRFSNQILLLVLYWTPLLWEGVLFAPTQFPKSHSSHTGRLYIFFLQMSSFIWCSKITSRHLGSVKWLMASFQNHQRNH